MSEYDVRIQLADGLGRVERRLERIEKYQTFLMLCVVFWAMVGMFAVRVDDFGGFMICVLAIGLCGFVVWHIRYGKQEHEEPPRGAAD